MSALKALIFDVDGTLADTERDGHRVAFNAAFDEIGLDWHWNETVYGELLAVTGGKERMRYYAETIPEAERSLRQLSSDPDDLIAALHAAKSGHYTALLASGAIRLRPGVERLLAEARTRNLRLGIATTSTLTNVHAMLAHNLGEQSIGWFDAIAAGDIVAAKKPAADIYLHALSVMALDPAECIALEDSNIGLRAALGAGLMTVITVNDYTAGQDFDGAAIVCDHLGDPGLPCRSIAGKPDLSLVDVAALQTIHETCRRPDRGISPP